MGQRDLQLFEIKEKLQAIQEALSIVKQLADSKLADTDCETEYPIDDIDEIQRLIIKARGVIASRGWGWL